MNESWNELVDQTISNPFDQLKKNWMNEWIDRWIDMYNPTILQSIIQLLLQLQNYNYTYNFDYYQSILYVRVNVNVTVNVNVNVRELWITSSYTCVYLYRFDAADKGEEFDDAIEKVKGN